MLVLNKLNKTYGEGVAIWVQQPQRRSITVGQTRHFLSFPAMVYRIHYREKYQGNNLVCRSLRVGFLKLGKRKKPTKKMPVFIPSLLNVVGEYDDQLTVCTGSPAIYNPELIDLIKLVIANFWGTAFNHDIEPSGYDIYKSRKIKPLSSFKKWAEKTKAEPSWIPDELIQCDNYEDFIDDGNFDSAFDPEDYDEEDGY